ncbi:hypothetical protein FQN55_002637 [Onygenales sp. PD_40]|nr:hypothetical protein FQN55_002637 [Onygenales sp. PD_40]
MVFQNTEAVDISGTAAQINASTGEPILVASVKGSDAYIAFVENSLQNEGMKDQWMGQWNLRDGNSSIPISQDPSSTYEGETIFDASLMAIKKEATRTLGESVDIRSISIPEHFNETLYGSVSNAGMKRVKVLESESHILGGYQNESPSDYDRWRSTKKTIANIRDAVEAALPEHKGKIRDTIDPHFVGAVGAAQWAKRQVLQPEILKDIPGFRQDEL